MRRLQHGFVHATLLVSFGLGSGELLHLDLVAHVAGLELVEIVVVRRELLVQDVPLLLELVHLRGLVREHAPQFVSLLRGLPQAVAHLLELALGHAVCVLEESELAARLLGRLLCALAPVLLGLEPLLVGGALRDELVEHGLHVLEGQALHIAAPRQGGPKESARRRVDEAPWAGKAGLHGRGRRLEGWLPILGHLARGGHRCGRYHNGRSGRRSFRAQRGRNACRVPAHLPLRRRCEGLLALELRRLPGDALLLELTLKLGEARRHLLLLLLLSQCHEVVTASCARTLLSLHSHGRGPLRHKSEAGDTAARARPERGGGALASHGCHLADG
mmetsp:Transcript_1047/g.3218  ORF Transcript_1047/g.3218 Transcript_1047/m.3218 type:complete len:332 (+) Transcript_1047:991-1986(+)